ncbi:3-hydroxyacyl-CoA dehydrogenase PaaC [Shimwellia pseudoproteus]|uniref:3-hydroxyacyl-CoA dehydrogenase PaaH n=1 Tax=Shimwellia pseudoproteus TaxID=570012 RepID=UPI0018EB57DC|nr:3-hydroxyacyl-CoA dehydrogenase PaaH [Shimwellia pseudoproteus]MBJ3813630.1 3-hydroxyacyl-CoA dehydrogenase PaaC [Shimwellia pseudoproteus]
MQISEHTRIAVIGSGTMGAGIAQLAASAGHPVQLYDISPAATARGLESIARSLQGRVDKGRLTPEAYQATLGRLHAADQLTDLADADIVIEAAAEKLEVKQQLFRALAEICAPQTLLTTNTSSISVTAIASGIAHPGRIAGLHFFNPAPVMKLVEVVKGLDSDSQTIESLCQLAGRWGKTAVRCQSTPGFIVNRVARPYYAEAWRALEEQVAPAAVIDAALRDGARFPMGPLELTDLIGQDVNFAVTCSVFNAFWQERRFLPSLVQQELVLAGKWGRKSQQGVYRWPRQHDELPVVRALPQEAAASLQRQGGPGMWLNGMARLTAHLSQSDLVADVPFLELDEVLVMATNGESAQQLARRYNRPVVVLDLADDYVNTPLVVMAAAATNRPDQTAKAIHFFQQQDKQVLLVADYPGLLAWRTVAMLVNEALDAVQKGVASADDIDVAMRLGVNYPHGPLAWGESLGWQRVLTVLENLQKHYGEERYRPSSLLRERALMEKHYEQ